jgi:hypothetical protein
LLTTISPSVGSRSPSYSNSDIEDSGISDVEAGATSTNNTEQNINGRRPAHIPQTFTRYGIPYRDPVSEHIAVFQGCNEALTPIRQAVTGPKVTYLRGQIIRLVSIGISLGGLGLLGYGTINAIMTHNRFLKNTHPFPRNDNNFISKYGAKFLGETLGGAVIMCLGVGVGVLASKLIEKSEVPDNVELVGVRTDSDAELEEARPASVYAPGDRLTAAVRQNPITEG